jgi:hypothetical protein
MDVGASLKKIAGRGNKPKKEHVVADEKGISNSQDSKAEELKAAISHLPEEAQTDILNKYDEAMIEVRRTEFKEETPEQADKRHLKYFIIKVIVSALVVMGSITVPLVLYLVFKSGNMTGIGDVTKAIITSVAEVIKIIFGITED